MQQLWSTGKAQASLRRFATTSDHETGRLSCSIPVRLAVIGVGAKSVPLANRAAVWLVDRRSGGGAGIRLLAYVPSALRRSAYWFDGDAFDHGIHKAGKGLVCGPRASGITQD